MMLVGFLLPPWAKLVRFLRCQPRALAGDLLAFDIGQDHEANLRRGYEATLSYVKALGAKVAPAKRYTCSTISSTRAKLGSHFWGGLWQDRAY